jgi:hypothetical protein
MGKPPGHAWRKGWITEYTANKIVEGRIHHRLVVYMACDTEGSLVFLPNTA